LIACSKLKPSKTTDKKNTDNRIELIIKDQKIRVEVAKTPEERALGLMFRQELGENTGMLFIFEQAGIYPFWMKFTNIPLSIAYIDQNDVIIDIIEMVPNQEEIRYSPTVPFICALEMNQGWFTEHSINIGDEILGIPK
jgi:uncharacterized membrane protein (UPF0127 family)